MSDVIVNHMSADSPRFQDFVRNGDSSPNSQMFLTMSSIFPDGVTEEDLAKIYRPRPGLPFTLMTVGDQTRLVWTTFTSSQVDIDLRSAQAWDYLTEIIRTLTQSGVTVLRLDAVGYTGKEAGTNCFMTEATQEYTQRIVDLAHARVATGAAASNLDLYQVNCTFYDALGACDARYLIARMIQLMAPGVPQVYYVGLLAGANDLELLKETGVGRDINREHFDAQKVGHALARPVVAMQLMSYTDQSRIVSITEAGLITSN